MNLGLKTGLLGTAAALAIAVTSVPAYAQDDLSALRSQLETMKERLAKLEADKADQRRVAAAAAVEAGDKPRSWKLPGTNTSMNIGGFVKMSVLWDFGNSGQTTGVSTTEGIGAGFHATEGSIADNTFNGGNFQFTARRSRIWFQTWTPTDWGELRTYIEADFAGSGSATGGPSTNLLRLRQAFGTLGPVLIGKTQTLFGGFIGLPELLHDGAPMALGALRIEQIRYSHNFGGGLVFNIALESPIGTSDAGEPQAGLVGGQCGATCASLSPTSFNSVSGFNGPARWPDVTASLQWNFPNGALYGSGMIGQRFVDRGGTTPGLNSNDSAIVWGAALGGRYEMGRIEVGFNGGVGQGIGNKYFDGGATGFNDSVLIVSANFGSADLRPVLTYGVLGYAQVKLTDTIRATGAFNWLQQNMADEVPGYHSISANRSVLTGIVNYYWAAFGNLLWNPVPQVTFGAEYGFQYASRYNSPNTTVHRLQLAAIYRF